MSKATQLFNYIKSIGVSADFPEENSITSMMSIMSLCTALGSFAISLVAFLITGDFVYSMVTFGIGVTYSIIVILHAFYLIKEARFYFSAIAPYWSVCALLSIGGYFGHGAVSLCTIGVTYMFYKNQPLFRNGLIVYNIFLFLLPTLYVSFNEPFFGIINYPIDELVCFILCVGWLSLVFFTHEEKNSALITSLSTKNKQLNQKTLEIQRFTHIASHDLKTPLRNIISFLNLIKLDLQKNKHDQLETYIDIAESAGIQMNLIIEGVMEITSTNYYNQPTNTRVLDFAAIAEKAIKVLAEEIQQKRAIITYDKLPNYRINEKEFLIVFKHIIHNGITYNQSSIPTIHISTEETATSIILNFKDNGIGISEQYHTQIFDYFKRLHLHEEYTGTGLGLGICKKIIERYEGTITVSSKPEKHSIFSIVLPKLEPLATEKNAELQTQSFS